MSHPTTAPLLENAADSLRVGVSQFLVRDEHPTAIKHAILSIYQSIELYLKARLSAIHPLLIYRNIDKRITDSSQTVGLPEILARLENLDIPLNRAHAASLVDLQAQRNRIEHFHFASSPDHERLVGQALKFLLEFLPTVGESLEEVVEETATYDKVLAAILSYTERVDHAKREAAGLGLAVVRCPYCGHDTVAMEVPGHGLCYFCREEPIFGHCERCDSLLPEEELDELGLCGDCLDSVLERT